MSIVKNNFEKIKSGMANTEKCLNFRFICENIKWQKEGEAD